MLNADKKKTKRLRKRWVIYPSLSLIFIILLGDLYLEIRGMPQGVKNRIEQRIRDKGLKIKIGQIKGGIFSGLIFEEVEVWDGKIDNCRLLSIEHIETVFSLDFKKPEVFSLKKFQISNGELDLPLFPEAGEEGLHDCIKLQNIEARVTCAAADRVNIEYASGNMGGILLQLSGSIEGLFVPVTPFITDRTKTREHLFSCVRIVEQIPWKTRCFVTREILQIRKKKFESSPRVQLQIDLNAKEIKKSILEAQLEIPAFIFNGEAVNGIRGTVTLKNQSAVLKTLRIELDNSESCEINGEYDIVEESLKGIITGSLNLNRMYPFLNQTVLPQDIFLGSAPVQFSFHLEEYSFNSRKCKGKLMFKVPELKFRGFIFHDLSALLFIDDNILRGREIGALLNNENRISGEFDFYPYEKELRISIRCTGNPAFISGLPEDNTQKLFMESLLSHFTWPQNSDSVELSSDIYYTWDMQPYFMLSGNIVVSDFGYNGINFSYGAGKFLIDSENLVIMPRIILERPEGHAVFSLAYDNRSKASSFCKSPYFEETENERNRLLFELESTIPGNVLLDCIIPGRKHIHMDLPEATPVKAHGVIDYLDPDKSVFSAKITNAKFIWNGIPVEKADTAIEYKNQNLQINDLSAKLYNGEVKFNYAFDYKRNSGNYFLEIKDSDFLSLMRVLGFKNFSSADPGTISGKAKANIEYNEKEELLMDGKGEFRVRNSDIWSIPFLQGLTELLGKPWIGNNWGKITSVDGEFGLEHNHIHSDSIRTDGSVVALSANGDYYWNTQEYDLNIRAEVLEDALPFHLVSRILDPLTWFFEARLHGKGKDWKWETISAVKRLFHLEDKEK